METKKSKTSGSLRVSEGVLARIALLAAGEVEGVALEETGKKLFGPAPVKVRLSKETAEIDLSVVVLQGHKAMTVGENIQRAVKTAVQNMTGVTVSKINVRIAGIRLTENGR